MQILKTIYDKDIFLDKDFNKISNKNLDVDKGNKIEYSKIRPTVKVVLIDENNKVCLLKARGHYLLPGGGVEKINDVYEDLEDALRREIREEVGCEIKDIVEIGIVEQYRDGLESHPKIKTTDNDNNSSKNKAISTKYIVYFYKAKVDDNKGLPTSTQEDELQGIEICWLDRREVIEIFAKQNDVIDEDEYAFCFNARSHYEAIQKAFEI